MQDERLTNERVKSSEDGTLTVLRLLSVQLVHLTTELREIRRSEILILKTPSLCEAVVAVLALLIFTFPVTTQGQATRKRQESKTQPVRLEPDAIYRKLLPSIMTLTVEKRDASTVTGTAFLIVENGVAATAWHVIRDAKRVVARFSTGEEFEASGLIDKDEQRDIALIRVRVPGRPPLQLSSIDPMIGVSAYVIGAPKGLEFSISDGLVSQIQTFEGIKQYQFSCPASPGNSGGPLVDAFGKVLGIVSWQVNQGQNLNFAVPAIYILALDRSLATKTWDSVKTPGSVGSQVAVSEEGEVNTFLANAFVINSDAKRAVLADIVLSATSYKENLAKFRSGVPASRPPLPVIPPFLFTAQFRLQENQSALSRRGVLTDPFKDMVRRILQREAEVLAAQVELAMRIIRTQQSEGYGSTEALNLASKEAALNKLIPEHLFTEYLDHYNALFDSVSFRSVLPSEAISSRDALAAALFGAYDSSKDGSGIELGVISLLKDPLTFLAVKEEGLAFRLGLRSGDHVISAGGSTVRMLTEFKMKVRESAGSDLSVTVQRNGDTLQIFLRVPSYLR